MPFTYYGGKKGSAHRYPPPAYSTIVEPFAGSAGYALKWATPSTRVILVERDPMLCDVWRHLLADDAAQWLADTPAHVVEGETAPPIVMLTTGHAYRGRVTQRIARDWSSARRRLIAAVPRIRGWELIEGDYTDAPDVRATWFVDPPYARKPDGRDPGGAYRYDGSAIDYATLGEWCRARRGQVIVCEQEGATWLPFRPLFVQHAQSGQPRVEVVWTRTPGRSLPGTRRFAEQHEARRQRRRSTT